MQALDWLWQDLRYGLRTLWKDRRFSGVAVVALALGIGATTVVFAAIYGVLISPFPYKNPDEIVTFYVHDATRPKQNGRLGLSVPEYSDYAERNHVFSDMMGIGGINILYTKAGETGAQLAVGAFTTPNTFEFLGVAPYLGRPVTLEDGKPGAPPVFTMSYRMWDSKFNHDPKLLGTTFILNDVPRTLVAIMPPRYLPNVADILIPFTAGHTDVSNRETGNLPLFLQTRGRLKPGVSLASAGADLNVIAQNFAPKYPQIYPKQFSILPAWLNDTVVFNFKPMLYALLGAVILLLLIACSNVANLLLARATIREKEIAIRASLGASRGRLIRQLLVEGFIVSMAGAIVACILAYFGVRGLVAVLPPTGISSSSVIEFNWHVMLFGLGVGLFTTLLCALAPALHAARGALYTQMTGAGKGASGGFRHGRLRAGLVVIEVALSIILLTGAGLMMRTLMALESVDLGINPTNILIVQPVLPRGPYDSADQKKVFFQKLLGRVTTMPGVLSATETIGLPPFGGITGDVTIPGKSHTERWLTASELCSEGYFQTFGLPALRGRLLSPADVDSARHVAVVNETLARTYYKDADPIGQTIKFNAFDTIPGAPQNTYFEIIGVTRDMKNQGLQEEPIPEAFLPYTITGLGNRLMFVRTASNPLLMLPTIRSEIWSLDSNIALGTLNMSLEQFFEQSAYALPKFGLFTIGTFAGIGLLLVIIGVFSVMAYSVSVQTHEIGVRMALGAQRRDILRMVIKKGLSLVALGIVAGLMASFALTRVLASQIWGVSPNDPLTFAAVVVVVITVGIAACLLPARRATQVDPMVALRYE